eukprot:GILI01004815.1.p1 GENE.GILI01004815.1~~GILI01004815.1.p1  ORF type:complete len:383 (+),score=156.32 GILI01004815.1:63-1211(+)
MNRLGQSIATVARSKQAASFSTLVFPREAEGVSYALNWAIAKDGVTPVNRAFGNLKTEELLKLAGKGAVTAVAGSKAAATFVVGSNAGSGVQKMDAKTFNSLYSEVVSSLSNAQTVLVHDRAVGSFRKDDIAVRAITDNAASSLLLRNLLAPVPKREPGQFLHGVTIYVAPSVSASAPLVAVSVEKGQVIVAGTSSLAAIQDGVAQLAARVLLKRAAPGLLLQSEVLQAERPVLLVGASASGLRSDRSFGVSHHVLTASGLSRAWNCTAVPASTPLAGDVLDEASKSLVRALPFRTAHLLPSPASIVFLEKGAAASSKLSADEAKAAFVQAKGFSDKPLVDDFNAAGDLLKNLIESSNAQVFRVKGDSPADLKSALQKVVKA